MFQPTHILVVKSGWVFAAIVPDWEPGKDVKTQQVRMIRKWGTTDGLAQLAIEVQSTGWK